MVVADAVLVDVVHGEGAGLPVVLAVAGALDGPVARRLDNGEDDVLRLVEVTVRTDRTHFFCIYICISKRLICLLNNSFFSS